MPRADAGGPTAGDPGVTHGCAGRATQFCPSGQAVSCEGPVVRANILHSLGLS